MSKNTDKFIDELYDHVVKSIEEEKRNRVRIPRTPTSPPLRRYLVKRSDGNLMVHEVGQRSVGGRLLVDFKIETSKSPLYDSGDQITISETELKYHIKLKNK